MTILTIAKAVAKNVGIEVPTTAVSSTDRDTVNLVQFSQEAADEIARRVDWADLRAVAALTGTGTNANFDLPDGFARLTPGMAVTVNGSPVRGGVSPDEWVSLTPIEGTPRYFRLIGTRISFYPYMDSATEARVTYQSKFWCSNGSSAWTADDETALVPEDLIVKGAVWRWKRHIGVDYADYLAEFEAALADYARFDDGARMP